MTETEIELTYDEITEAYTALSEMMQEHRFDNRMLNLAILKNARRLEDKAEALLQEKQEIIREHADRWTEEEIEEKFGDQPPAHVEPGEIKIQQIGSQQLPQFESEDKREVAESKLDATFDGSETFTLKTVPEEAMDIPEGETLGLWSGLEWMFAGEE